MHCVTVAVETHDTPGASGGSVGRSGKSVGGDVVFVGGKKSGGVPVGFGTQYMPVQSLPQLAVHRGPGSPGLKVTAGP